MEDSELRGELERRTPSEEVALIRDALRDEHDLDDRARLISELGGLVASGHEWPYDWPALHHPDALRGLSQPLPELPQRDRNRPPWPLQ
jgi:hypothetical protein